MYHEKNLVSRCCGAETKYSARGWKYKKGISVPHLCLKCQRACDVTAVCVHCDGTGKVPSDEVDRDGNTERGVGTMDCVCKISNKTSDEE
jgi:hypothetical protein